MNLRLTERGKKKNFCDWSRSRGSETTLELKNPVVTEGIMVYSVSSQKTNEPVRERTS